MKLPRLALLALPFILLAGGCAPGLPTAPAVPVETVDAAETAPSKAGTGFAGGGTR